MGSNNKRNKMDTMTSEEFNEKYKDYLEERHYGLDINIPEIIEYLDDVFQDLIKIPGFKYSQIKIKYVDSRVYTNLNTILPSFARGIESVMEQRLNWYIKVENEIQKRRENFKYITK